MPLPRDHLQILLVGSAGREHAFAWKLCQSPLVEAVFVVPGNGGTDHSLPKVANVNGVSAKNFDDRLEVAKTSKINFVVPSAEEPLVGSFVYKFQQGTKSLLIQFKRSFLLNNDFLQPGFAVSDHPKRQHV